MGILLYILFFAVPAVGAHVAFRQIDGLQNALQCLILQGGEMQLVADGLAQLLTPLGGSVHVFIQMVEALFALQLQDGSPGNE